VNHFLRMSWESELLLDVWLLLLVGLLVNHSLRLNRVCDQRFRLRFLCTTLHLGIHLRKSTWHAETRDLGVSLSAL
jgi:hypothetical protein